MRLSEILKILLFGIVEGVTEWLPISSTGHMILLEEFIKPDVSEAFMEMFFVVIQLGAVLAVPVFFFHRLNPFSGKKTKEERQSTLSLWGKVLVGMLPAAIFGLLLDDLLDRYLFNMPVVALALVVYGVLFILIEGRCRRRRFRVEDAEALTYGDALAIGLFQVLSLIPGTSRSGSTILGGMLIGTSRVAAAEFSFFMAIPVMLGASGLKLVKYLVGSLESGVFATGEEWGLLAIGVLVSFLVSLAVIRFLMDFVKRHDFRPFGIYRIVLGAVVLGYFLLKAFVL